MTPPAECQDVDVIVPALNEEEALPAVIAEIPKGLVRRIVVVDNGSTDRTVAAARAAGAEVVQERRRGYGRACMAGLVYLAAHPPEIVVFLDADRSDYPEDLHDILSPFRDGDTDMVCGSRIERAHARALPPHVRWGNLLATRMIRLLFGHYFRDLGPFRALRWQALRSLMMLDPTFGWNVEMQVKAVQKGLCIVEVPVRYRPRLGRSKISGTLKGTLLAGYKIITTILALRFAPRWYARRAV